MVNEVNQMPSTIPNWGLWNLLYIPFLALCIMTPNGCFLGRFTIPFPTWLMSAVLDQRTFRSQLWSAHVLKPWQTQENFFLIFPPNRPMFVGTQPFIHHRWSTVGHGHDTVVIWKAVCTACKCFKSAAQPGSTCSTMPSNHTTAHNRGRVPPSTISTYLPQGLIWIIHNQSNKIHPNPPKLRSNHPKSSKSIQESPKTSKCQWQFSLPRKWLNQASSAVHLALAWIGPPRQRASGLARKVTEFQHCVRTGGFTG